MTYAPKKEHSKGTRHVSRNGKVYYTYKIRKGIKHISCTGKVYYKYKKKKVKKKKKPAVKKVVKRKYVRKAPKRRKKLVVKKPVKVIQEPVFKPHYRLILFHNQKQYAVLGKHDTKIGAFNKKNKLIEQSNNVQFPKLLCNNGREDINIYENNYEVLILEELETSGETVTLLPNEFGKNVPLTCSNTQWRIIDRFPYNIEEEFWVWGYDYKKDRKQYAWILDNLFVNNPNVSQSDWVRVLVYNNKLLIKYDFQDFDMIVCKHLDDSIRLYNKLKDDLSKDKRFLFSGRVDLRSQIGVDTTHLIMQKTGWSRTRTVQMSTRR